MMLYQRGPGVSNSAKAQTWNRLPPAMKATNSLLPFLKETKVQTIFSGLIGSHSHDS